MPPLSANDLAPAPTPALDCREGRRVEVGEEQEDEAARERGERE
jgi:hypothetical protein